MTKNIFLKCYNFIEKYIYVLAPFLALILFLVLSKMNNIAPLGDKNVSWCDLNQQGIPLLNQFKDILQGKQSLNGNLLAGGMSYFGVFFFYIASPFSFLVIFVDKAYMQDFVDIIIMLKMATAAFTFSFYLKKKYPSLDGLIILALSIFYSFSGYVMMYYQTLTWLDMIYLFPLLILSLDILIDKGKIIPYIIIVTLIVCINYYIGIMAVFYIILYFGGTLFYYRKEKNVKELAFKFLISSFIAVLLSMLILIPSLIDYRASSRTISITDSIKQSWIITPYETAIPLVLGLTVLIPFLFNNRQKDQKIIKLILLALLSIPLIIDPINKMWHYGSYQAFPCRFAFINIFLMLDIIALLLFEDKDEKANKTNIIKWIIGLSISAIFIIFSFIFEQKYTANNMGSLERYTHSLWGNLTSFEALLRYYAIIFVVISVIYFLYRIKTIPKKGLGIIFLCFAIIESAFSFKVYMVSAAHTSESYRDYYEIVNLIDDDSYYNVKTNTKYNNVNDVGGAGYNNFGHYTSLTPKSYMDGLKKLGYSSYWMEVGAYGGTILNDAILMNKYTLYSGKNDSAKYTSSKYHIKENRILPLGIVTKNNLKEYETLGEGNRGLMQKSISNALFNNPDLVTVYDYTELDGIIDKSDSSGIKYDLVEYCNSGSIIYEIDVTNKTRFYFEAFDKYNNSLSQSINESIDVRMLNYNLAKTYPAQNSNGFVDIGEFKNQKIKIEIRLKKSIECSSLSLFGINVDELENIIDNTNHADMKYINKHFEGTYEAEDDSYMFLPIAYTKDVNVTINNKRVEAFKVFDGFVGIKLEKGINHINVSYSKAGLIQGAFIFVLGFGLLISYFVLQDQKRLSIIFENDKLKTISYYLVIAGTLLLLIMLYLFPIVLNIIGYIK